jgi:hypothetical protein
MNGLIPSNDPEKKNLNLEIFSTDIVEYISIDKVYNSSIYGDFAGDVDIISKITKERLCQNRYAQKNTNAISNDNFSLQKGINSFG